MRAKDRDTETIMRQSAIDAVIKVMDERATSDRETAMCGKIMFEINRLEGGKSDDTDKSWRADVGSNGADQNGA